MIIPEKVRKLLRNRKTVQSQESGDNSVQVQNSVIDVDVVDADQTLPDSATIEEYTKHILMLNNKITELSRALKNQNTENAREYNEMREKVFNLERIANGLERVLDNVLKVNPDLYINRFGYNKVSPAEYYRQNYGRLPKDNREIVVSDVCKVVYYKTDTTANTYKPVVDWRERRNGGY